MKLSALLVIVSLATQTPLDSFGIPPFTSAALAREAAFSCTAIAAAALTPTAPVTADWIARQVDERDTGKDSRIAMAMKLVDRQGRGRERSLSVRALRRHGDVGDRVLVRFTYPADIAGTGFLVWERPDGDDDRFLYLPALGRVRRISGAERQESFVGSDFTYEDIGGRAIEDYAYALLEENATWADAAGAKHPAWRLESKARDADATYPRVVSTIRKDNFVVVAAEVYNRRGERAKAYTVSKLAQVQGIWTVMASSMANEIERTRTELLVTEARYDTGLAEKDFSRRELENGAR